MHPVHTVTQTITAFSDKEQIMHGSKERENEREARENWLRQEERMQNRCPWQNVHVQVQHKRDQRTTRNK